MSNTETWEKATGAGIWIVAMDAKGNETPRRIAGPAGTRFKVRDVERESYSESYLDPKDDAFRNGTFLPVTISKDEAAKQIPGFDAEQVLTDEELAALFASSGAPFQAKVNKLSEVNKRRLAALLEENAELASVAQAKFLESVLEQYRPTFTFDPVAID